MKTQWKNIRDSYVRAKARRNKQLVGTGSKRGRLATCQFYDELELLCDKESDESTISFENICSPNHSSIESHSDEDHSNTIPAVTPKQTSSKRKISQKVDPVDFMLMQSLKDSKTVAEDDPDMLRCKSLWATMKDLSPENNTPACIKMQQILFDF